MGELKYVIFDCSEIDKIDFTEVKETSKDTLRKSVNGKKTFIKFEGLIPSSINQLETKSNVYSQYQMLNILSTDEWTITTEMI